MNAAAGTTLGILAGGRGSRLGGLDKAWLERGGVPLVLSLSRRLAPGVDAVLVGANGDPARFRAHELRMVPDRIAGIGPLGGIDALAHACVTPWLFTLPVDVTSMEEDVVHGLRAAGGDSDGAWAEDDDGPQPLVALWRVEALREALVPALAAREHAVHALQSRLRMGRVRFAGARFGNLNTPGDLAAAGIAH